MIGYDEKRKTYFVQYQVKDPLTGKWNTRKKRGFKLKRDAAQYEATVKIEKTDNKNKEENTFNLGEQYFKVITDDMEIFKKMFSNH